MPIDACVKVYLRNELLYRIRTLNNYKKHYISISELSKNEQEKLYYIILYYIILYYIGSYPSDDFHKKITIRLFDTVIHDELLNNCLQHDRDKVKARFSAAMSVINPDRSTAMI